MSPIAAATTNMNLKEVSVRTGYALARRPCDGADVVHVVAHSHEQIEKQFSAHFHLHLHGAASLKGRSTPNDESQVMCPQLGVIVWGVGVSVPGAGEDGATLDAGLQALLA